MIDKECPFHCNASNQVFDRQSRTWVVCPHCSDYAQHRVFTRDSDIYKDLGFSENLNITPTLDFDAILPDYEVSRITPESLEDVRTTCEELWSNLTQGILPSRSVCIGLGIKGRLHLLAYPLLATAYSAGLTCCPLLTATELMNAKLMENMELLDRVLTSQVAVLVVEEGSTRSGLHTVKGVMQTRALKGLPTIILTTWMINAVNVLLDKDPLSGNVLADPHMVLYKTGDQEKYSRYTMGILGLDNQINRIRVES